MEDNNLFKSFYKQYYDLGYIIIPDSYGDKKPAIKAWTNYNKKDPTPEELQKWAEIGPTNISLLLGEASGVVALDVDTTDGTLINWLADHFPTSPYEKVGSKGFTRLYRWSGQKTQTLKINGEVVVEILSTGKKTTLPPSKHPAGNNYIWSHKSLLDGTKEDLPELPPTIIEACRLHIAGLKGQEIKEETIKNGNVNMETTGRCSSLSSYTGELIEANLDVQTAVKRLVEHDRKEHSDNPYFSDATEHRHTEAYTNALAFYASHLNTTNANRLDNNIEYHVPLIIETKEEKEEAVLGKPEAHQNQENLNTLDSFRPLGVMGEMYDTILNNSFIKQPAFAISTSLVIMSTIIGRKVTFSNLAPNLYVLNIAASGAGKNAPQDFAKEVLVDNNLGALLGSGNYVSDASLMEGFDIKPVRLDIIDEASGLLGAAASSSSGYDGKMAEILCELYSCSNSKFAGRTTAEGVKGECYRPNVNLLCSTTHRGFKSSLNQTALEKGLLSRFLYFEGFSDRKGQRVKENKQISTMAAQALTNWFRYKPAEDAESLSKGVATRLKTTKKAGEMLDGVFAKYDEMRIEYKDDNLRNPIISRLFQQLCKITMISCASRYGYCSDNLIIEECDVEYATKLVDHIYTTTIRLVSNNLFRNKQEEKANEVLQLIRQEGGISTKDLFLKTLHLSSKERDNILTDLRNHEIVEVYSRKSPEDIVDTFYCMKEL